MSGAKAASGSGSSSGSGAGAGSASGERKKVRVALLSELHGSTECALKNISAMKGAIDSYRLGRGEVLFVSEALWTNQCYVAIGAHPSSILREHDSKMQTTDEMLDRMILTTELAEHIAEGGKMRSPDGRLVDKAFVVERLEKEGYIGLLEKVPGGKAVASYRAALDLAEKGDMDGFLEQLKLTYTLVRAEGLDDQPEDKKRFFTSLLTRVIDGSGRSAAAKPALALLANARERSLIARVEQEVLKNPRFKYVVIIFGAIHYPRLKSLIEKSGILSFDSTFSSSTAGGKRRRRGARQTLRRRHRSTRRTRRRS